MSLVVEPNVFFQVKAEDYNLIIAKYDMTDKMVWESIENIRQWYGMQPHMPPGAISDSRLFRLLLATNFRPEMVKQKIGNLFTARNVLPDLMGDRDPGSERMKSVRKYVQWAVLQQRLEDMSRVIVATYYCEDFTNFNIYDVIKMAFLAYDYRISSDLSTGDHYVMDCKHIKFNHVMPVTPALMKNMLFVLRSCFGAKIKGIHYLNVPIYAKFIITILRPMLGKKIASRTHIHNDMESLHKLIPKSVLPSDLGGSNKANAQLADDLYEQLSTPEMREWFLKQDQFKTNESKRVGAATSKFDDLVGLQGLFRSLDID